MLARRATCSELKIPRGLLRFSFFRGREITLGGGANLITSLLPIVCHCVFILLLPPCRQ